MIIGGYIRAADGEDQYVELREVSFACTADELNELARFFASFHKEVAEYSFPYGPCFSHFCKFAEKQTKTSPDVVLCIYPSDAPPERLWQ